MRLTSKCQVTIPRGIRDLAGLPDAIGRISRKSV